MDFDQRASQLERLAALLQSGSITEQEFSSQKSKILNDEVDKISENKNQMEGVSEAAPNRSYQKVDEPPKAISSESEAAKFELYVNILEKVFFVWASFVAAYWVTSNPESAPQQAALAAQALVLVAIPYCALATFQRRHARNFRGLVDE